MKGEIRLAEMGAAKDNAPKARSAFAIHPQIIVDNAASRRHTVLQVSGVDRPGLLYDLTNALSNLNLNIGSAHVATFGEKAVDTFYVSDLTGAKILDENRQNTILHSRPKAQRRRPLDFRPRAPDIRTHFRSLGDAR